VETEQVGKQQSRIEAKEHLAASGRAIEIGSCLAAE
jgi:hypothetical protein